MQVASVQLAARAVGDADLALEESLAAISAAADLGADLVVLPECTWPGYVLGSSWPQVSGRLAPADTVMARYARLAAEAGIVLVVGLALDHGGVTRNAAVVWDVDGTLRGMVSKRFLWDFDRRWFTAGDDSPVFETAAGRIGVLVCADGRMPEIARLLAVGGAEIILDPTAWDRGQRSQDLDQSPVRAHAAHAGTRERRVDGGRQQGRHRTRRDRLLRPLLHHRPGRTRRRRGTERSPGDHHGGRRTARAGVPGDQTA